MLPRRREGNGRRKYKDETGSLKKMGDALGWNSWDTTHGRAISNPKTDPNNVLQEIPGKGHVRTPAYSGDPDKRFKGTKGIK